MVWIIVRCNSPKIIVSNSAFFSFFNYLPLKKIRKWQFIVPRNRTAEMIVGNITIKYNYCYCQNLFTPPAKKTFGHVIFTKNFNFISKKLLRKTYESVPLYRLLLESI